MDSKTTLSVRAIVGSPHCLASDDAQRVHDHLVAALRAGAPVTLSFQGVTTLTAAFLNVALGQLYRSFSTETIRATLRIQDLEPDGRLLLERVMDNATIYYSKRSLTMIAFLFLLIPVLLAPPVSGEPLVRSSNTYTVTARSSGFSDAFTRCLQALYAAKAALPQPKAHQTAAFTIDRLVENPERQQCTATVSVTLMFVFPPSPDKNDLDARTFTIPPQSQTLIS